jgi:hypothetical protein
MGTAVLAVLAGQSYVDPQTTYNLFEVKGVSFIPLVEFNSPSVVRVRVGEVFYVDVPVGKHRFLIARSKVNFFVRHLVGSYVALDIDVTEGQTVPVFFGPAPFDPKHLWHPLSIRPYPLKDEDIAFCYALRDMNTTDVDRLAQADERVYEYFTDPQTGFKLDLALTALTLMGPAAPSNDFKKWAKEKQADLAKDYAETDISHSRAVPYNVYKNADRKK